MRCLYFIMLMVLVVSSTASAASFSDLQTNNMVFRNRSTALNDHSIKPGYLAGHLTVKPSSNNSTGRLYIEPNGTVAGVSAAMKWFFDDYEVLSRAGSTDYRDFGIFTNSAEGSYGSIFLNSKVGIGGTYYHNNPPILVTFDDSSVNTAAGFYFTNFSGTNYPQVSLGGKIPTGITNFNGIGAFFTKDAAVAPGKMLRFYSSDGAIAGNGLKLDEFNNMEVYVGNTVRETINAATGSHAFGAGISVAGSVVVSRSTGAVDDTTPSVSGKSFLQIPTTTAPYTITNFDDSIEGQNLTVLCSDAYPTIQANANITTADGQDIACKTNRAIRFVKGNVKWHEVGRPLKKISGANVASAATITPTGDVFHVTGTTTISTINLPVDGYGFTGSITIIPDGIFTTNTAGNIALASTSVVNKALVMTYDAGTAKWYPSY